MRVFARNLLWMSLLVSVSACSSVDKYNPFSAEKPAETYKPANATEYQCEGNKRFFVRMLNKENAAWLIYPDREVRLEAASEGGNRYTNSVAVLEIQDTETTLSDGPNINYKACQAIATTK
jgi:membrane-bound inhibitor of C-type lysozyme